MKTRENKSVDQAWNLLYQRLEQDGLLTTENTERQQAHTYIHRNGTKRLVTWAVSIAALIAAVIVAGTLALRPATTVTPQLLTLHSAKGDPTLVTSFEDGSIIYLSEQASLEYPSHFADDKREVSLQGTAFFEVSKNRQRPFIIQTEGATVEVLGTSFRVESQDSNDFSLSVRTGMVKVTSKKDQTTVLVKAGQKVWLDGGTLQTAATTNEWDNYLRHIHFKDQHLADVARIINENTDSVQLKIDPTLGDRQITVTFQNDTPETMARVICAVMNLEFSRQQNILYITQK